MAQLQPSEISLILFSLGILLAAALLFGEIARRLSQPPIIGEILAGVFLGKTVFGTISPDLFERIFPSSGNVPTFLQGFTTIAIVLFLLVAGFEVNLSSLLRQGKTALSVSVIGIAVTFSIGLLSVYSAPDFFGQFGGNNLLVFTFFFATVISISALPVIVRILIDLNIFRSDIGMLVVAAAIINDLAGWIIFAIILSLVTTIHDWPVIFTIGSVVLYTIFVFTIGRWAIHRILPWIQAHTSWPGGVLSVSVSLAFFGAAFTEWIGIHAIFGSFLVGVAIGDSVHLRQHTRTILNDFVSFIFAPLFFASIGLRVDFLAHFNLLLTIVIIVLTLFGKIGGCTIGARLGGLPFRASVAVGSAMSASGAMGIILGMLALNYKIINEEMFVSIIIMALVTSIVAGPLIQYFLRQTKRIHFRKFLSPGGFISALKGLDRDQVIEEMSMAAQRLTKIDSQYIFNAVIAREKIIPTGLGQGLAVPHARLENLKAPIVLVGFSKIGIDCNSPDGKPVKVFFLILTPVLDHTMQVHILASIAELVRNKDILEKMQIVNSYAEFIALIRTNSD